MVPKQLEGTLRRRRGSSPSGSDDIDDARGNGRRNGRQGRRRRGRVSNTQLDDRIRLLERMIDECSRQALGSRCNRSGRSSSGGARFNARTSQRRGRSGKRCVRDFSVGRSRNGSQRQSGTKCQRRSRSTSDASSRSFSSAAESAPSSQRSLRANSADRKRRRTRKSSGRTGGTCSRDAVTPPSARELEVYVGDLPCCSNCTNIKECFVNHLQALPEYRVRYSDDFQPVQKVNFPPPKTASPSGRTRYVFVTFSDTTLASTAVAMTGLRLCGRSVKVSRPSEAPPDCAPPLDVGPLRSEGRLPFCCWPGARMLCEVWVCGLTSGLCMDDGESLRSEMNAALLGIPSVREQYPDIDRLVLRAQLSGNYAFVEVATEILASTLVAMTEVSLPCGVRVRINWPSSAVDASARAPLPLLLDGYIPPHLVPGNGLLALGDAKDTDVGAGAGSDVAKVSALAVVDESQCEVYIGNVRCCEPLQLRQGLSRLLACLPSYKTKYNESFQPILDIKTGKFQFAFARAADPVLASTLCAIGDFRLHGVRMWMRRPSSYQVPTDGPAVPLEVEPQAAGSDRPEEAAFATTVCKLWVGNLLLGPEEAGLLEAHLTKLAINEPTYDIESGPPLEGPVRLHHCGRFAFASVRDAALAQMLMPVWDGSWFQGRPLAVNMAHGRQNVKVADGQRGASGGLAAVTSGAAAGHSDLEGSVSDCSEVDPDEL
eukprot:TRINITY_DN27733_c0_g2_i1.p1 TRINITY_DN27733_c0_g2~~TRINITY_DN27733_c0_g2_i1.p1  ORF type:complete len:825 (-),score=114.57 TRINITY_DN27733_c0_g2_i1:41-2179(-)